MNELKTRTFINTVNTQNKTNLLEVQSASLSKCDSSDSKQIQVRPPNRIFIKSHSFCLINIKNYITEKEFKHFLLKKDRNFCYKINFLNSLLQKQEGFDSKDLQSIQKLFTITENDYDFECQEKQKILCESLSFLEKTRKNQIIGIQIKKIFLKMIYIIKKHLNHFQIFFCLEQTPQENKTDYFCEHQLKNLFQNRVEEWKKTVPQNKILLCRICLKKFISDNPELMTFHSLKCKEMAEVHQILQKGLKNMKNVKKECDLLKSQLQFENILEKKKNKKYIKLLNNTEDNLQDYTLSINLDLYRKKMNSLHNSQNNSNGDFKDLLVSKVRLFLKRSSKISAFSYAASPVRVNHTSSISDENTITRRNTSSFINLFKDVMLRTSNENIPLLSTITEVNIRIPARKIKKAFTPLNSSPNALKNDVDKSFNSNIIFGNMKNDSFDEKKDKVGYRINLIKNSQKISQNEILLGVFIETDLIFSELNGQYNSKYDDFIIQKLQKQIMSLYLSDIFESRSIEKQQWVGKLDHVKEFLNLIEEYLFNLEKNYSIHQILESYNDNNCSPIKRKFFNKFTGHDSKKKLSIYCKNSSKEMPFFLRKNSFSSSKEIEKKFLESNSSKLKKKLNNLNENSNYNKKLETISFFINPLMLSSDRLKSGQEISSLKMVKSVDKFSALGSKQPSFILKKFQEDNNNPFFVASQKSYEHLQIKSSLETDSDDDVFNEKDNKSNYSDKQTGAACRNLDYGLNLDFIENTNFKLEIGISDFRFIRMINKGAYGRVYLVKRKQTEDYYAMKIVNVVDHANKNKMESLQNESEVFDKICCNDFFVKCFFRFTHKTFLCFVMEYMYGDMSGLLKKYESFEENTSRFYIAELILAVEHLHQLNIIHRDLKPDNILLDSRGHIKLADFGLSTISLKNIENYDNLNDEFEEQFEKLDKSLEFNENNLNILPVDLCRSKELINIELKQIPINSKEQISFPIVNQSKNISLNGNLKSLHSRRQNRIVGTPDYIAPEILSGDGDLKNPALDYWSIGIILFEFLVGIPPFNDQTIDKIFENIRYHRIPWNDIEIGDEPNMLSFVAYDLLTKLLEPDPDKRLGKNKLCMGIKEHPFFKNVDWDNIKNTEAPIIPNQKQISENNIMNKGSILVDPFLNTENENDNLEAMEMLKNEIFKQTRYDFLDHENMKNIENLRISKLI